MATKELRSKRRKEWWNWQRKTGVGKLPRMYVGKWVNSEVARKEIGIQAERIRKKEFSDHMEGKIFLIR